MNTILKSLIFAAAVSFAGNSNATPTQYTIDGVLTQYTVNNLPSFGISVGDSFTGELFFDPAGWTAAPPAGLYRDYSSGAANGLRFNINIGGQKFSMTPGGWPNELRVSDSLAGDSVEFSGIETLFTPWGPQTGFDGWNLLLSDLAGGALSSVAVPSGLNLVDWPDAHYIHAQGFMPVLPEPGRYSVTFDIRSMTAVPDVANTGLLLVLVLSILLCMRRLSRLTSWLRRQFSFVNPPAE